ncbi:MAG TPA: hypothetical protein VGK28_09735 [Candidatus Dormibacteraeota bacterium]|jgi:hypothetical protein
MSADRPISARFDKHGNRLPETGHGCGCQICADAHAASVEGTWPWSRAVRFVRNLLADPGRPQAA